MNITPKDILEKEFSKKLNGYDQEEVDEFLDEIIRCFESLLEENEYIIAENGKLKAEIKKMKHELERPADIEEKLMSTVIAAQRNANGYIEKAEEQAQRIIDTAAQNAKTLLESTQLQMEAAKQEIRRYEKQASDYKKRFRLLLEEQIAFVDSKIETQIISDSAENNSEDNAQDVSFLSEGM